MFLLIGFISSVFVPYSLTEDISYQALDHDDLVKNIESSPFIISLTEGNSKSEIILAFDEAESLFPEANFVISSSKSIKKLSNSTKIPEKPFLTFFQNGNYITSVGPIESSSSLLYLIDLMLYKRRPVLRNTPELVAALGEAPITIVSQHKNFEHTFSVSKESMTQVGPINIVTLSDPAAREISLEDNSCAIFRAIDQELIPIDCNRLDIEHYSIPTFNLARPLNLKKSNQTSFILHADGQLAEFSPLMHQLGTNFPHLNFFLDIDRSVCKFINDFIPNFCDHANIAMIDFNSRYSFNITQYTDPDIVGYTFSTKLIQQIPKIIESYEKGRLQKIPISEKVPRPTKYSVKKLVGKNYESFVNDTTKDVLVLFLKPESKECSQAFTHFKLIADDIGQLPDDDKNESTEVNFTFGYILTEFNQIEGGFPHYPDEPAFILYSANDKKHPRLLLGSEVSDIQHQLQLFASHKPNFESLQKLGDMEHFKKISDVAKTAIKNMTQNEKVTLIDTLKKVEAAFVQAEQEQAKSEL